MEHIKAVVGVGLLISVSLHCAFAELNDTCATPDSFNGVCVALRDCPMLYLLLKKISDSQPVSPYDSEINRFLSSTQCGQESSSQPLHPLVCCRIAEGPPDVSHHANIRLINKSTCGIYIPNRLIGGQATSVTDFRWMVLLAYESGNTTDFRCGGTLINERYVLTAAHCIANNRNLVFVRLGEHNTSSDTDCEGKGQDKFCADSPQDLGIEESLVHPEYSQELLVNDVALIRLNGAANIGRYISTICLPVGLDQTRDLDNQNLTVAGWGATENATVSSVLLKVALPSIPNADCHATYKALHNINVDEKQMCAGGSALHQDSCNGDSGGPLKMKGVKPDTWNKLVQFGIVAYGPKKCATEGVPGVYTRVSHYMQWILDQMRP